MADSPVTIDETKEEVQGQPQAQPADPHDGKTLVHEVVVHTDKVILDPNDPLAVQVPEGVGASTYGQAAPLGEALAAGTAEEQFAAANKSSSSSSTPKSDSKS